MNMSSLRSVVSTERRFSFCAKFLSAFTSSFCSVFMSSATALSFSMTSWLVIFASASCLIDDELVSVKDLT